VPFIKTIPIIILITPLSIEPLEFIVLCKHGSVCPSAARILTLLGVDGMKLRRLVAAANKDPEVNVSWTRRVWHGGNAKLSKQMNSVGTCGGPDLLKIVGAETDEVLV
jgi:hypothetical protein